LRRFGHVSRKDETDWVKCMDYKLERVRPRSRPKKTWSEVAEKDCKIPQLHGEDAMNRSKCGKLIQGIVYDIHKVRE